jgi:hypothetical protein
LDGTARGIATSSAPDRFPVNSTPPQDVLTHYKAGNKVPAGAVHNENKALRNAGPAAGVSFWRENPATGGRS